MRTVFILNNPFKGPRSVSLQHFFFLYAPLIILIRFIKVYLFCFSMTISILSMTCKMKKNVFAMICLRHEYRYTLCCDWPKSLQRHARPTPVYLNGEITKSKSLLCLCAPTIVASLHRISGFNCPFRQKHQIKLINEKCQNHI